MYITNTVKVVYFVDLVQISEIESAIERLGYRVTSKKYPSLASMLKKLFRKEQ